jgi:acetylornithine deacetylase/succinyl-diaminopimelate desuccinylase-like protein
MLKLLEKYISIRTLAGDKESNQEAINFLKKLFEEINFEFVVEGNSPNFQPTIIAKYENPNSKNRVVLYSHYDVETVKNSTNWISKEPFQMEEIDDRLYGRGIADNKGIFIARYTAIKKMIQNNEELPSILWLIQGEEEVGGLTPFEVFPKYLENFNSKVFVEETAYHNNNIQLLLSLPEQKHDFISELEEKLFSNKVKIENRYLNKFFLAGKCPFLESIPKEGLYIGFGPNDELSNIHRDNESLNKNLLFEHVEQFQKFLEILNKTENL